MCVYIFLNFLKRKERTEKENNEFNNAASFVLSLELLRLSSLSRLVSKLFYSCSAHLFKLVLPANTITIAPHHTKNSLKNELKRRNKYRHENIFFRMLQYQI
uniref:Uncharacterized protein n=1 Tax=Cacopsylla melanoneura TaxID=428564 RepID=A0A8D8TUS0_9HEMI